MTPTIATPSAAVNAMSPDWELARALLGGTRAMREAGQAHLPKWPNEEQKAYEARLATAVLYPAYQRTVTTLTGKPFAKALTLGEDVPGNIKAFCDDIDLQGRNLDAFASDIMESALGYGLAGILVDFPVVDQTAVKTLADERKLGLRPYAIQVFPWQVLGWMASRVNGNWQLLQLRLMEEVEEPDGLYAVKCIQQVRLLTPGGWQTFRRGQDKEDWILHSQGTTTLGYIPYVPVYGQRTGFMTGKPPLLELANLNVKHWISQSDQDTLLHVARVPILTIRQGGDKFELTVGASAAVNLGDNPQAELKYVEHSGKAIEAGKTSLDDLKDEMRQSGAEMLVLAQVQKTATETASEDSVGMCALSRIVQGEEDALDYMLQIFADWTSQPTGGHVTLFKDFAAATLSDASAQMVLSLQQGGLLSKATALQEMKRRNVISPDTDIEKELEDAEAEGPALGVMGGDIDPETGLPRVPAALPGTV